MIELKNIGVTFQQNKQDFQAVKNVNLTIEEGEIFGIVGPSGAGKSTLVRVINLLQPPTAGQVLIEGNEITSLKRKELCKVRLDIGMIFQHFNLMRSRTVGENVAYPLKGSGLTKQQIKAKVKELLELVDIAEKENAYPSQLSGGQKQRVAIARALANDPKVLLCDEATSALDPQTTGAILQLLKHLNKKLGITIVIITHEMAVVKEICDRVAVMEHGNVVEEGDVFSIFAAPKAGITRDFIRTTSNLQKIEKLIEDKSPLVELKPGEKILRLNYIKKNTSEALISETSRKFNINLNIIFADLEIVQDAPIGGTVAIASGRKEDIEGAVEYLKAKNVGVEVIENG